VKHAATPKVYLAGPDVFFGNAVEIGRRKKAICVRHGLQGLFPLDNEVPDGDPTGVAMQIYVLNCRLMDQADAIIANMTPFRGVSMDVGTAFEIGYMRAQSKPIFAYSNETDPSDYAGRMRSLSLLALRTRPLVDHHGLTVEDFGLSDNLMMSCAVIEAGNTLVTENDLDLLDSEFSVFEECVRRAVAKLRG
jgi:nucleoside 2-deoxyribosyltransferase